MTGRSVRICEAADDVGGSAAMSYGVLRTFGSVEAFRRLNPSGEPGSAAACVTGFEPAVGMLVDLGIDLETNLCLRRPQTRTGGCCGPDSIYSRHFRFREPRVAMRQLAEEFERRGGEITCGTRVDNLQARSTGIAGVDVVAGAATSRIDADVVVLATGGFQGNVELLTRYVGPWAGLMPLRSNPHSVGDGLLLGLSVGASGSRGLHAFYGHLLPSPPMVPGPDNFVATSAYYSPLAVLVNRSGRRFVDESISDDANARAAVREPGARVFAVFDAAADRARVDLDPSGADRILAARTAGAEVLSASTLDDLVTMVSAWGVPQAPLAQTLAEFNRSMDTDDPQALDVPRSSHRRSISEPPFYAVALVPAVTSTFGGLRVDERCRVLDRHGSAIAGLFAGGADAGGVYVETYGGGLGAALATGWVAGGLGDS
jgi:succinate dehydrogenase/fumarate reductase flavoprotein subunit